VVMMVAGRGGDPEGEGALSAAGPSGFRVVNVVVSARLPGRVDLARLLTLMPELQYRPRLFPGAVLKIEEDGARVAILIFESGRMICAGGRSPEMAYKAVRSLASRLVELGIIPPGEPEMRTENVVAEFSLGAPVNVERAATRMEGAIYEPEQFPGMMVRLDTKAALVFSSGKAILAGAKSVEEARDLAMEVSRRVAEALRDEGQDRERGGGG